MLIFNCRQVLLGKIITIQNCIDAVMCTEESRHKFMNMWAKFLINDLMGMLKKKKKTIKEAPNPLLFRHYLLAYHFEKISRNELRQYVDSLI